ncbi:Fic family protein [Streptosporangium sp. NBC_01755]|uniref:Fic family protein n=1 Tax=unclassified Streptosporangium TaxID=2632669 RepID=UPI002DDA566D|nr:MULTISPECIES: Fic family protein [unclassified Streptosporangium]WSA24108.1 Fic family protein [Streptosporangium sp. NBC_01810]WSC97820.1 Fic family protein [Streptosporangium sp. NBC_01755]
MRWREVEALPELNGGVAAILASADALKGAWKDWLKHAPEEEFRQARRRSLRRHAIETGIIERLYDVDWGVTLALVAEGLTQEVAAREGGISDDTLAVIRSQYDALEFLADAARGGRDLSVHFVRELHQAIARRQNVYGATDTLGRTFDAPLRHGEWKKHPNHVMRPDGTLLEYTPPEHVQAQMDHLITLYRTMERVHPIVKAAWLHHRFICVHPFEDGNGRVARALTLLVLLRDDYAPLVVDRSQRARYIDALDQANDGDLAPLVRLFARLEISALRFELEAPAVLREAASGAAEVARAHVDRLRANLSKDVTNRAVPAVHLADSLQTKIIHYLRKQGDALRDAFSAIAPETLVLVEQAQPPNQRSLLRRDHFRSMASGAGFRPNLTEGVWWGQLYIEIMEYVLHFDTAIIKAGAAETGALVFTVSAAVSPPGEPERTEPPGPVWVCHPTPDDSVTLVFSDTPDARWSEITEVIDQVLTAAVDQLGQQLG